MTQAPPSHDATDPVDAGPSADDQDPGTSATQSGPRRGPARVLRTLSPAEARVVAVLVEKERTVPDTYPLSLNSLVAGCNQKTSRDPVMQLAESEVLATLDELKGLSLVIESSGGRVLRYSHNLDRVLGIGRESVALVAMLMLRGPQTAAELRANAERLARFADVSSVEGYLEELATRPALATGGLVVLLPRRPGSRESRWAHCLCGQPTESMGGEGGVVSPASSSAAPGGFGSAGGLRAVDDGLQGGAAGAAELARQICALQSELADLRRTVARLCTALGEPIDPPGADQG